MLAALFGAVVGQAVTFYTATFYAYYFLERVARVDAATVTVLTGIAIAIGAPLVLACGWLSDRIGRKPPLLAGLALAVLLYFPLFGALLDAANPALAKARADAPVVLRADPADCSLQFDPMGRRAFDGSSCDVVRSFLARAGIGHATFALASPSPARLEIGGVVMAAPDPARLGGAMRARRRSRTSSGARGPRWKPRAMGWLRIPRPSTGRAWSRCSSRSSASPRSCTGPYSALLAELFPARIRYTALSFPQNFGNGWFGGLLPAVAFTIVAATGNVFAGLWYPVSLAALCFVVGALALPETRGRPIALTLTRLGEFLELELRELHVAQSRAIPPAHVFFLGDGEQLRIDAPRNRGSGASRRVVKRAVRDHLARRGEELVGALHDGLDVGLFLPGSPCAASCVGSSMFPGRRHAPCAPPGSARGPVPTRCRRVNRRPAAVGPGTLSANGTEESSCSTTQSSFSSSP